MYDQHAKGISYGAGFFMLITFAVTGFILSSFISAAVWSGMTGRSIKELETAMTDPANSNALKVMHVITLVTTFLIPTWVTAAIMNRHPGKLLGFTTRINFRQILIVFVIMISAMLVSTGLSYLNEKIPIYPSWKTWFDQLENSYNTQVEAIISLDNTGEFIIALLIMAFLPALCEEALFRGGLQNFLSRSTALPWLSIAIVSLLFSAAHLSYYGFLSRFFLGVTLGLVFHFTGRLWLSILAHFVNNAFAITVIYVYKMQGGSMKDILRDSNGTWFGIIALPLVIALLIYLQKISASTRTEPQMLPNQNQPGNLFP